MQPHYDFLVIIPTHKRPETLRAAIVGALAQSGVTKKVIVADDSPEGSAREVVAEFPDVLYLQNSKPSGGWPGRVRNLAFDYACRMSITSRFVHFLDDDDTVPKGHYLFVKETFQRNPAIGVVFGVLRPFCTLSSDPDRRRRQEMQLRGVRDWRIRAARFPWLYEEVGNLFRAPNIRRWLYWCHATFGPEMFLCSGGVIRYEHVSQLGGFPDIRITEDFCFYTEAIRRFGVLFVKREAAGYGVGNPAALWNPLDLHGAAKVAHQNEWVAILRSRKRSIRARMGFIKYYGLRLPFEAGVRIVSWLFVPILDRRGYFNELYSLTDPDYFLQKARLADHHGV